MVAWPASLPQKPLQNGTVESPPDVTIRTPMDVGPAKLRRRITAGVRKFTIALPPMTSAQVTTLDTFFTVTIAGGALSFSWVNPRTQIAAAKVRIVGMPTYTALSGDTYAVSFAMEILP